MTLKKVGNDYLVRVHTSIHLKSATKTTNTANQPAAPRSLFGCNVFFVCKAKHMVADKTKGKRYAQVLEYNTVTN